MRNTITAPFRRIMRTPSPTSVHEVHFHADGDGRAFVCDHHRCESPKLSGQELGLTA
jgi:hypothetical protein